MTNVLLTGAAGFIGSHVVAALLARGERVVGVDNFDPFYARPMKERNLRVDRIAPLHAKAENLKFGPQIPQTTKAARQFLPPAHSILAVFALSVHPRHADCRLNGDSLVKRQPPSNAKHISFLPAVKPAIKSSPIFALSRRITLIARR
jgi:hypothetical protein